MENQKKGRDKEMDAKFFSIVKYLTACIVLMGWKIDEKVKNFVLAQNIPHGYS